MIEHRRRWVSGPDEAGWTPVEGRGHSHLVGHVKDVGFYPMLNGQPLK